MRWVTFCKCTGCTFIAVNLNHKETLVYYCFWEYPPVGVKPWMVHWRSIVQNSSQSIYKYLGEKQIYERVHSLLVEKKVCNAVLKSNFCLLIFGTRVDSQRFCCCKTFDKEKGRSWNYWMHCQVKKKGNFVQKFFWKRHFPVTQEKVKRKGWVFLLKVKKTIWLENVATKSSGGKVVQEFKLFLHVFCIAISFQMRSVWSWIFGYIFTQK